MNPEELDITGFANSPVEVAKNADKNTNKEYLIDQFNYGTRTAENFLQKHPELNLLTSFIQERRDNEANKYSRPELDVYLFQDNVVNILTLMNSVDKILTGKVFLGRVIIKPRQWNESTFFLAEDPQGERAVRIAIENNPLPFFNTGAFVGVVNPCFQTAPDGGIEVRSNDVLLLTEEDMLSKFPKLKWHSEEDEDEDDVDDKDVNFDLDLTGLDQKEKFARLKYSGNKNFVAGNYNVAIQMYSKGLALCPEDEDLLANRALCYLKTENYHTALKDALNCLIKNPPHVKAIHRAAQAYIGLKQPEKAKSLLESKLKLDLPKKDLRKMLTRAEDLVAQKKFGRYDMITLFKSMETFVQHDISDYLGPVTIKNIPDKGRGLMATRDIKAGELIVSSQAFAVYVSSQGDYFEAVSALLKIIIQKVKKAPLLRKELYKLSAGTKLGHLDTNKDDWTRIDVDRIRGIIKVNCFRKKLKGGQECFGLWLMPSYINNDCHYSNCSNVLFGNVRQIRSLRPLKKGEEILISYRTLAKPLGQLLFSDPQFSTTCECEYCKYESGGPKEARFQRHGIIKSFLNGKFQDPNELVEIICQITEISNQSPFADHYLAYPLVKLGGLYFARKEYEKAKDTYIRFLKSWPSCGSDVTIWLCAVSERLFRCYINLYDLENAHKTVESCLKYVKLRYGRCDNEFLETLYPGITKSLEEINESLNKCKK